MSDRRIYFGLDNGLSNFEFLSCILLIGGSIIMAVVMDTILKILISVDVIDIKTVENKYKERISNFLSRN